MPKKIVTQDNVGKTFHFLTVKEEFILDQRRWWKCKCICGEWTNVTRSAVLYGSTRSCGCWRNKFAVKHGQAPANGQTSPEYRARKGMIQRCYNPSAPHYDSYGGRGITVCEAWRNDAARFLADVGLRPSPKHSLDRYPNKNGNYEPGNVRWATQTEQMRNTRVNRNITFNNQTKCVTAWAETLGITKGALRARLDKWPLERALTELPHLTKPKKV